MKTLFSTAMFVLGLTVTSILATTAQAQQAPGVRVIDINRIFKNHIRFKADMEGFKKYVESIEANLKAKRANIGNMEKNALQFKDGTDQRKAEDRKLLEAKAKFNAEAAEKRKDIMRTEAKIYHKFYKEIQNEVTYYCNVKKVAIVIRYNSEKVTGSDRASIMRAIANPIVVQNNIDITDTILRVLNGGKTPSPSTNGQANNQGLGNTRPRQ